MSKSWCHMGLIYSGQGASSTEIERETEEGAEKKVREQSAAAAKLFSTAAAAVDKPPK